MGHILGKKMSQRKGEVNSMTEFIIEFNKLTGIMGRRHAQNFFFFLLGLLEVKYFYLMISYFFPSCLLKAVLIGRRLSTCSVLHSSVYAPHPRMS